MRAFGVGMRQDTVMVRQGEQARLTFTVTNVSGRAVRALLKLVPQEDEHAGWLGLAGGTCRDLEDAQTATAVVDIRPPADAPPGTGKFRVVVASEENPDVDFADAVAQFTVTQAAIPAPVRVGRRPRRWWTVAAAGAAVAIATPVVGLVRPETRIPVPSVMGMGSEEAEAKLQEAGFDKFKQEFVGMPSSAAGERADLRVCEQEPKAETAAPAGTAVRLTMVPTAYTYGGGRGPGDEEFRDDEDVVDKGPISRIDVYELDLDDGRRVITGYRLWYGEGPDQAEGGIHDCREEPEGESEGDPDKTWRVPDDDKITRVKGRIVGGYVTQLQFFADGKEIPLTSGKSGDAGSASGTSVVQEFEAPGPGVGPLRTITACGPRTVPPDFMGLPPERAWKVWWFSEFGLEAFRILSLRAAAAKEEWAHAAVEARLDAFRTRYKPKDRRLGTPWAPVQQDKNKPDCELWPSLKWPDGDKEGTDEQGTRVPEWVCRGGLTRITFHFDTEGLEREAGE